MEWMDARCIVVTGWREATVETHGTFILEKLAAVRTTKTTALYDGCARGVDNIAHIWAKSQKLATRRFRANWAYYGGAAGPARNGQMIKAAIEDFGTVNILGVAFPHPSSVGTIDCMTKFERLGIRYVKFDLWTPVAEAHQ